MVDFFKAAFPWIAGGIAVAVILAYGSQKDSEKDNNS